METAATSQLPRVLFVDDEPRVLHGLRLGFWSYRDELTTEYCTGGAEALELLAGEPFDAVVSDMRMPEMDGEALLRRVQLVHPDVVRVVLSGQTDRKVAARMVHVAHQFLSKPCDVSVIRQRLGELSERLGHQRPKHARSRRPPRWRQGRGRARAGRIHVGHVKVDVSRSPTESSNA